MIPKRFEQVGRADIESLVTNQVREGRQLDYKQEMPGRNDAAKKEFLADISSFANAAGGDLYYGVIEQLDAEGRKTGVPERAPGLAGLNADEEIRRLDSMIQSGIGPRISGYRIRPVEGFPDGPVLLVRVPKSFAAPHMVTFQEYSRFYSRNNAGKYPLDVGEIRSAFALSEGLPEKVRRFRDERLARIVAGDTPLNLGDAPKVVIHILPLTSLGSGWAIDIDRLKYDFGGLRLPCFEMTDGNPHFNFDGLVTVDPRAQGQNGCAYAQAFRSGAVEFADIWTLSSGVGAGRLRAKAVEKSVVLGLQEYLRMMPALGIAAPVVVMPSVLGVLGWQIRISDEEGPRAIDRNDLMLPDVLLDDLVIDAGMVLRPSFDAMWQAAGWRRSQSYNTQGFWMGT
jgi:hypothetical protein